MTDNSIINPNTLNIIANSFFDRPMLLACCGTGTGVKEGISGCGDGKTGDQRAVGVGGIVATAEYVSDHIEDGISEGLREGDHVTATEYDRDGLVVVLSEGLTVTVPETVPETDKE